LRTTPRNFRTSGTSKQTSGQSSPSWKTCSRKERRAGYGLPSDPCPAAFAHAQPRDRAKNPTIFCAAAFAHTALRARANGNPNARLESVKGKAPKTEG
jgi:hypothetical protein